MHSFSKPIKIVIGAVITLVACLLVYVFVLKDGGLLDTGYSALAGKANETTQSIMGTDIMPDDIMPTGGAGIDDDIYKINN